MGEHVRVSVNLNALEETLEMLASATRENQRLQAELAAVAERCAPLVEAAERLLATDGQQVWDALGYAKARRDLEALLAAYHARPPGAKPEALISNLCRSGAHKSCASTWITMDCECECHAAQGAGRGRCR